MVAVVVWTIPRNPGHYLPVASGDRHAAARDIRLQNSTHTSRRFDRVSSPDHGVNSTRHNQPSYLQLGWIKNWSWFVYHTPTYTALSETHRSPETFSWVKYRSNVVFRQFDHTVNNASFSRSAASARETLINAPLPLVDSAFDERCRDPINARRQTNVADRTGASSRRNYRPQCATPHCRCRCEVDRSRAWRPLHRRSR